MGEGAGQVACCLGGKDAQRCDPFSDSRPDGTGGAEYSGERQIQLKIRHNFQSITKFISQATKAEETKKKKEKKKKSKTKQEIETENALLAK